LTGNTEKVIDFRDSLSSISLLKVTQVFGKMKPSGILEIRGTDSDTRQDVFKLLPHASYEVLEAESAQKDGELSRVVLRKR
jgi:TusA-related sulfurtransferase